MQLPDFAVDAFGGVVYHFTRLQPLLPTYLHLLLSAVFPIYAGAHSSLSRPSSAAKREKRRNKDDLEESEDEDDEPLQMEGLSPSDAIMFPILAGCTLAGLYFLIKWLQDPAILNKILNAYFALFSLFSVARLVSDGLDVVHSLVFPHDYVDGGVLYRVKPKLKLAIPDSNNAAIPTRSTPLPGLLSHIPLSTRITDLLWILYVLPVRKFQVNAHIKLLLDVKLALGLHGIIGFVAGFTTVVWYNFISKPWFLTNIMGFGFAYGTLQILSPTTFATGSLILLGLFFYDIYFVFYTPIMVTVASSLDIPVKLVFPRPPEPPEIQLDPLKKIDRPEKALSMLGLGDVVLPGILIGLALRFDLFLFYLKKQTKKLKIPSSKTNTPTRTRSRSRPGRSKSPAVHARTSELVKAPYQSVAEGWGDRLWTTNFLGPFRSNRYSSGTLGPSNYTARNAFPKTYFHVSLTGYIAGMLLTLGAMEMTGLPQPALLYLVPSVVTALWGTAWYRGEAKAMWEFSDANNGSEADKKAKEEKEKDKKRGRATAKKTTKTEVSDDPKDATIEDQNDSSVADRTRSRSPRSSFFSRERSEARAQRLSDSLSGPQRKSSRSKSRRKTQEPERWFSFSMTLPTFSPSNKSGRSGRSKARRSTANPFDSDEDQNQRYSLRSTGRKNERVGKRQRVN